MPFFWVSSVLMGFLFLLTLMLMYNMIMGSMCFVFNGLEEFGEFFIKW